MTMEIQGIMTNPMEVANYRDLDQIKWIVIHHSATNSGNVDIFRRVHKSWGWVDVGYHYVICNGNGGANGEVQPGRPLEMVGAHALGANVVSVGICLVGDFMQSIPTNKQWQSLIDLCVSLMKKFDIPPEHVIGHKEVPAYFSQKYSTDCPGINFHLGVLRQELKNRTKADYVGHWAENEIREVLKLGIMHGYSDGTFRPDQPATRAELAVGLYNLYHKLKGGI